MSEDPKPLGGVLQVGDLRVGPYMWLEMCERAGRAEFLLALMAACKPQTENEHIEERNSLRDRALERTIAAQYAEASLSALRREVGDVTREVGAALAWLDLKKLHADSPYHHAAVRHMLDSVAQLHVSVSKGQQDQSAFGGEELGSSGGREAGRLQASPTVAPSVAGWDDPRGPIWHDLKTWPRYYRPCRRGEKTFEIRRADRDYRVGDFLRLREWDPVAESYSGDEDYFGVQYILPGGSFGLELGHVAMAIAPTGERPTAPDDGEK